MKLSKISLALFGTLVLIGCDSDDSASEVAARTITLSTDVVIDDIVGAQAEFPPTPNGEVVIRQIDANGYSHFLRVDGYEVRVTDSVDGYGRDFTIPADKIGNINSGDVFEFDVYGGAKVELVWVGEHTNEGSYKYYTAYAMTELDRTQNSIVLEAYNRDYGFVTAEVTEDIDGLNSTINNNNFGLVTYKIEGTGRKAEEVTDPYYYGYTIGAADVLLMSAVNGGVYEDTIPVEGAQWFDMGEITIGEDGSIIIKDPVFNPIVPTPPSEPIVDNSKITGAKIVGIHANTGAVTLKGDNKEAYVYPDAYSPLFDGTKTLNQYIIDIDVTGVDVLNGEGDAYANIYLVSQVGNKSTLRKFAMAVEADPETGKKAIWTVDEDKEGIFYEKFEDMTDFKLHYGEYFVYNWPDSGRLNTNFIVRLGDSMHDATGSTWSVNKLTVTTVE